MDTLGLRALLIAKDGANQAIPMYSLATVDEWTTDLEKMLVAKAIELKNANRIIAEKEHFLAVFHQIGQVTLSSLDLDEVLDNLIEQIIHSGIFNSFMIAMVDEKNEEAQIVRTFNRSQSAEDGDNEAVARRVRWRVKDGDVVTAVARQGKMLVTDSRGAQTISPKRPAGERRNTKVFFYIPVKKEDRVLAVLGTASKPEEKLEMLERIDLMQPLLDQLAIALEHATTASQLQEAQSHLIQADKLTSLGQLAAGVAHEINNPVSFVGSNIAMLGEYVEVFKSLIERYEGLSQQLSTVQESQYKELLERISILRQNEDLTYLLKDVDELLKESQGGVERVTEIAKGLKSFARMDGGELELANVNDGILEILEILWNELKYKGQIQKDLGDALPSILCYPGQLKQVFMNVLTNAAQAIEDQGKITIKTRANDTNLVIRIADTGMGIPKEIQQRIFEPFFTTKTVGQGTGLGLAISYGIIQAHQGRIRFVSVEGQGSEFIIELPLK